MLIGSILVATCGSSTALFIYCAVLHHDATPFLRLCDKAEIPPPNLRNASSAADPFRQTSHQPRIRLSRRWTTMEVTDASEGAVLQLKLRIIR